MIPLPNLTSSQQLATTASVGNQNFNLTSGGQGLSPVVLIGLLAAVGLILWLLLRK